MKDDFHHLIQVAGGFFYSDDIGMFVCQL